MRPPAHIATMEVKCPKCSVVFMSGPSGRWAFGDSPCEELRGTRWASDPNWCPVLSDAVELVSAETLLLPYGSRTVVEAEIAAVRAKSTEKGYG